ncbi:MAG: NUDIX hydrolase [Actinomycetota bacterium]|nr:NUDIX hydrolase [Actinomycetota bacterium]
MDGFRKLTETEIWRSPLLRLTKGRFVSPGGEEFERDIVHHPGAVVVVPMVDDHRAVVVRQYRAAIDAELLELPAGKRDVDGEAPEVTAARELNEEVGRSAGRLDLLARFYNSPGFSDELSHVYLARDLSKVGNDLQGIEERHMQEEEISLDDLDDLLASGAIVDAKTIIGLTLAARALRGGTA